MLTRRDLWTTVGRPAQIPPAGPVVALPTPVRVYDSRIDPILPGHRKLQTGDSVIVTVAAFEGFATAVFLNVTITETEGTGYLVLFASDPSGERPLPRTSNINWSSSGITLANFAVSAVGAENGVVVHCQGGGRTHVVVDVYGYVPFAG